MEIQVSIIIPCYNASLYIEKCIISMLEQTYISFEIIIINDGSKDNTGKICDHYATKDNRIKVFHQENKGVSAARNLGIKNARGHKIMFIDADDYIAPNFLKSLIDSADLDNDKSVSLCGMTHIIKGKEIQNKNFSILTKNKSITLNKAQILDLFQYESLSSPCCKLYDASLIKQNNIVFDTAVTYQEDLIFNLEYFKLVDEVIVAPNYNYFYVEQATSSSIKFHPQLFHALKIVYEKLSDYSEIDHYQEYFKTFLNYQILNNLHNINHSNSNFSFNRKRVQIDAILNSSIFNFSSSDIHKLPINFVLKFIIQRKLARLIILYYTLNRIMK
jgi:glycosyltransferase involved in cell wall biosynthesis